MAFCLNFIPLVVTLTVQWRIHYHNMATLLACKLALMLFMCWHTSGKKILTMVTYFICRKYNSTCRPESCESRTAMTKCVTFDTKKNHYVTCDFCALKYCILRYLPLVCLLKWKISLPQAPYFMHSWSAQQCWKQSGQWGTPSLINDHFAVL